MSKDYKIHIHKARPTEANPYVVVAAYVSGLGCIGTYARIFPSHAIERYWIAERPMTKSERECVDKCWRMHYYRYTSWEKLISDEWLSTADLKWCNELARIGGLKTVQLGATLIIPTQKEIKIHIKQSIRNSKD